jgi:hypothetical protein
MRDQAIPTIQWNGGNMEWVATKVHEECPEMEFRTLCGLVATGYIEAFRAPKVECKNCIRIRKSRLREVSIAKAVSNLRAARKILRNASYGQGWSPRA